MLCDICKKKQATVHITEIINNKMTELHLCEDCAKEKSFQMEQHFGLADLLAGLSDIEVSLKEDQKSALKCSNCGLSYEDFRKIGRLGCSQCYDSFKENLEPLLKRIHRATKHSGSAPLKRKSSKTSSDGKESKNNITEESKIEILKQQMAEAVKKEAFEEAAKLRDMINNLKKDKK